MKLLSEVMGDHELNDGTGSTLEDLLNFLKTIPAKVRRDSYLMVVIGDDVKDVTGIHFGQSDQSQKTEFKAYLVTK